MTCSNRLQPRVHSIETTSFRGGAGAPYYTSIAFASLHVRSGWLECFEAGSHPRDPLDFEERCWHCSSREISYNPSGGLFRTHAPEPFSHAGDSFFQPALPWQSVNPA